jgi:hypothetical protein
MQDDEPVSLGGELDRLCGNIADQVWHRYFESIVSEGRGRPGPARWATATSDDPALANLLLQAALQAASTMLHTINSHAPSRAGDD